MENAVLETGLKELYKKFGFTIKMLQDPWHGEEQFYAITLISKYLHDNGYLERDIAKIFNRRTVAIIRSLKLYDYFVNNNKRFRQLHDQFNPVPIVRSKS